MTSLQRLSNGSLTALSAGIRAIAFGSGARRVAREAGALLGASGGGGGGGGGGGEKALLRLVRDDLGALY
jgi:hypothetical protein